MHETATETLFGLSPLWLATSILVLTYAVIISERFNRAIVALIGAALVIGTGVLTQEQAEARGSVKVGNRLLRRPRFVDRMEGDS